MLAYLEGIDRGYLAAGALALVYLIYVSALAWCRVLLTPCQDVLARAKLAGLRVRAGLGHQGGRGAHVRGALLTFWQDHKKQTLEAHK
jgi:hypothetical protein